MKGIPVSEEDGRLLWRLKLALAEQLQKDAAARATASPIFVVWHGRNEEDPERRINVVCFTLVEAEFVMRKEAHRGPMYIEVCSCARAPLSRWLLDWALRCGLEAIEEPKPAEQKELALT